MIATLTDAIKNKIAKFSKLTFNLSTHHDAKFDKTLYVDNTKNFVVNDVKFYKNVERLDMLTLTRADVDARLKNVALYDRLAFERAFDFEATYLICCNSKSVALNLTHHERKYSTLYRRIALYAKRADLYLTCMMSDKQRKDAFKSKYFLLAIEKQVKTLTLQDVKNAKLHDSLVKTYAIAFNTLQNVFTTHLTSNKTSKLVKSRQVAKRDSKVAVK
jgi:hypothetical protein